MTSRNRMLALIFAVFLTMGGCGSETAANLGGPIEVREENILARIHEQSPVPFEEYIEFTSQGQVETWSVAAPFGASVFGDFRLSLEDRNADSYMDFMSQSLIGSLKQNVFLQFYDKDLDGKPDMMSYGVMMGARASQRVNWVDLNLDGFFDSMNSSQEGMKVLVNGSWVAVVEVSDIYTSDSPSAIADVTGKSFAFHSGKWNELEGGG